MSQERESPQPQDEAPSPSGREPNPNLLRDRLANERTFLAWLRTGIAISALGFVVARFELLLSELAVLEGQQFDDSQLALAIGTLLVLAGPAVVTVAAVKFSQIERRLVGDAGGDGSISLRTVVVLTVGLALAGIGLAIHLVDKWPR